MKWKDSGDMNGKVEEVKEAYFDEEQYSPWAKRKNAAPARLDRPSVVFVLLGLAIVTSVTALLMLLLGSHGGNSNKEEMALLQKKVNGLEERLDRYDAIDEKVTRIWEQAKSFEKFRDRFDRDEASISLRMDHLTMGLEKLQKQMGDVRATPPSVSAAITSRQPGHPAPEPLGPSAYHTVAAGDTFYSISRHYNVEVEDLLKLNGLNKDSILKIGQKLVVGGRQEN